MPTYPPSPTSPPLSHFSSLARLSCFFSRMYLLISASHPSQFLNDSGGVHNKSILRYAKQLFMRSNVEDPKWNDTPTGHTQAGSPVAAKRGSLQRRASRIAITESTVQAIEKAKTLALELEDDGLPPEISPLSPHHTRLGGGQGRKSLSGPGTLSPNRDRPVSPLSPGHRAARTPASFASPGDHRNTAQRRASMGRNSTIGSSMSGQAMESTIDAQLTLTEFLHLVWRVAQVRDKSPSVGILDNRVHAFT